MALINCPECNKGISDKANSCPSCGYSIVRKNNVSNTGLNKNIGCLPGAFILLLVGAILIFALNRSDGTNPITNVLDVSWRYSMLNSGTGVLQIKNITKSPISGVTIDYYNQDNKQKQSYTVGKINGFAEIEVGILESGWAIEPNEVITVNAAYYNSVAIYFWKDAEGNLTYEEGYGKKKLKQFLLKAQDMLK